VSESYVWPQPGVDLGDSTTTGQNTDQQIQQLGPRSVLHRLQRLV